MAPLDPEPPLEPDWVHLPEPTDFEMDLREQGFSDAEIDQEIRREREWHLEQKYDAERKGE